MPLLPPEIDRRLTLRWSDEFTGSGPVDAARWRHEDMVADAQHRASNNGLKGMRHAARYDRFADELARRENGQLVMRSRVVEERNPYRIDWRDDRGHHRYGSQTFYTSWIDTCARRYANGQHVPAGPAVTFSPPVLLSVQLSFAEMSVPGARFSIWLMPAPPLESDAYDEDAGHGAEIDVFEYDVARPHLLVSKVIAGNALSTPTRPIDAREYGVDLTQGTHTLGLLWEPDRLVWLLNGQQILEDRVLVPRVAQYLILSQELNSGVKSGRPGVPYDPGLFPPASVALHSERFATHRILVDHVRVYDVAMSRRAFARRAADLLRRKIAWIRRRRERAA